MLTETWPLNRIKPNPRNPRTHPAKQIRQIANSIKAFGFTTPLLVDEHGMLIAGHARYKAMELLGFTTAPVIIVGGLSPAQQRALAIADNKLALNAGWDRELLAIEIPELMELLPAEGLEISILGFEPAEIDQLEADFEAHSSEPEDELDPAWADGALVSKPGDLWILGNHRLLCGDARNADDVARLMNGRTADVAFLDPPYNVRVAGIVGRGKIKHTEFAVASGELSPADFIGFLTATLGAAAAVSRGGAVHFVCMDWRHISELMTAAKPVYGDALNVVVWVKTNAGQGSFYRSQHELIGVFRVGQTSTSITSSWAGTADRDQTSGTMPG